jgi:hypothetical protein
VLHGPQAVPFGAAGPSARPPSYHDKETRQMPRKMIAKAVLMASSLLFLGNAFAQPVDKEPAAVVELGGVADRSLKGGGSSFGPAVAAEVMLIEKWLELEAGVAPLFGRRSTEWDADLLFKKPWTLSKRAEFMLGVGPEWVHGTVKGVTTNSVGVEVAPDFMFWPSAKHRFGWYLEPSYGYSFGRGHEQSVSMTGGLLIAIPRPARRHAFR